MYTELRCIGRVAIQPTIVSTVRYFKISLCALDFNALHCAFCWVQSNGSFFFLQPKEGTLPKVGGAQGRWAGGGWGGGHSPILMLLNSPLPTL